MAGSRLSRASRFTPLRTATRIRATLPGDQRIERCAHIRSWDLDPDPRLPRRVEEHEPWDAADGLLVPGESGPRPLPVDAHRLRPQRFLDRLRLQAREP